METEDDSEASIAVDVGHINEDERRWKSRYGCKKKTCCPCAVKVFIISDILALLTLWAMILLEMMSAYFDDDADETKQLQAIIRR